MGARQSARHDQNNGEQRLAAPVSPIVGRELQIEQALSLLLEQGVRLLTITGPGGIGKTRLAREVAHRLVRRQAGGAIFVELDSVTNPDLAAVAIARAVGVPEQSGDIENVLCDWMRGDDFLLILDNFEQVLEAAPLLSRLLSHCPSLSIMVTSRIAPLHLEGERVLAVGPLGFPADDAALDATLIGYPAVSYFLQHAPTVDLTTSAEAVVRICRRLDGIPLALELAAARVGLLTVEEIADQTTGWLPLLTTARRDAPPRHRTMEATIQWSYELLDDDLQARFRALSVFAGGFARDAAQAVAAVTPDQLAVLIENRLVEPASNASGRARLRLLEPVRDFGLQAADEHGELEHIRGRHAAWAREVAHSVSPNLFGSRLYSAEGPQLVEMLELERGNLTGALAWLIERGDTGGALHIAGVLSDFWYRRTYPNEGLKWLGDTFDLAIASAVDPSPELVKTCTGTVLLAQVAGDFARCARVGARALAAARAIQDDRALGETLAVLGYVALNQRHFERATELSEQALGIFEQPQFEDRAWQADLHENLAHAAIHRGDVERASFHVERGIALTREGGDPWAICSALFALGDVRCYQGRLLEALDIYEESFDITAHQDGASLSSLWHQAVHGMAGCTTVAHLAFPEEPEIALPMMRRTEQLCRQMSLASPNNRITYGRIRDDYLRQGLLARRRQTGSQPAVSLPDALQQTRDSFALLRQLIEERGVAELPAGTLLAPAAQPVRPLTRKQLSTVRHIVDGKTIKEIAAIDEVGVSTVHERIERIRERWGLQPHATLAEIAVFAVRNGIA